MPIHALDLPILRSLPNYQVLNTTLESLIVPAPTFLAPPADPLDSGILTWLTRLISHPLPQLSAGQRDEIYALASALLSTECGRTARPSLTRTFKIPAQAGSTSRGELTIEIHEPTLTADSLGLKTWSTSFLISRSLHQILPSPPEGTVMELGSGTGLLGIAIAKLFSVEVTLTDYLVEIVANLQTNVERNQALARVELLDWTRPEACILCGTQYDLVVASDFMYDVSHAGLVVDMLNQFTRPGGMVLAAYPLRESNVDFIQDFAMRMSMSDVWQELKTGKECGYDDWGGTEQTIVHWHVYRRLS